MNRKTQKYFIKNIRETALVLMKKRGFFSIFLLGCSLSISSAAGASDDFQYWSGLNLTKKISPDSRIFYEPGLRLREDAGDFYYHEHRLGVQQQLSGPYTVGVHYLIGRTQKTNDVWQTENRGEADLTGKWDWQPFKISLRGRAELRYMEDDGKDELWRFRIKPQLAYPMKWAQIDVTPYVSDDVFYDAGADAWNLNRFYVGAVFPIKKEDNLTVNFDIYYMLENRRSAASDWSANHILGTKIALLF